MARTGASAKRTYPGGTVETLYERGQPSGSKISTDIGTFTLPHWPSRIKDVKSQLGGIVVVETRAGERRFFGPEDALEEGGGPVLLEATTGSSMGGHSPKAHGKIRYIVRAFGKWAGGKQHICVDRLLKEHPDVVGGSRARANGLCAWVKDQWAGTTKWRGPGSNPKIKARDEGIEQRARGTAYARFSHAMPEMTNYELDALVEIFTDFYPVEDMLSELGLKVEDRDPYEVLAEHDADSNLAAIAVASSRMNLAEGTVDAMETWLAAHGDVKSIEEAELAPAVQRITRGEGSLTAANDLDRRVIEAMQIGRPTEPWDMAPARLSDALQEELETQDVRRPEVSIELPPPPKGHDPTMVIEGDYLRSGEAATPRADLMRMQFNDLCDRARQLYEATLAPTPDGCRYLDSCGKVELARIVAHLETAFARDKEGADEALTEADDETQGILQDPAFRPAMNTPGWDSPKRGKKMPTELDEMTLKEPPDLRRGHRKRMCGSCLNFADGGCRAYGNYPVSAGELCDSWQGIQPLQEADGYMTRGGEDVGHYSRLGRGRKMALHLKPTDGGAYDEAVVRMGLSRMSNPDNPTDEVHIGHVRVKHRRGEFHVEPDWAEHPESEHNPELAKYSTVRHGAKHVVGVANTRVEREESSDDPTLRVDAGPEQSPANPQWPMMPQMGEASSGDVADLIVAGLLSD
jgi:hypothetical protein